MNENSDPYKLQRFIDAQETTYEQALSELRQGRKTSHWIWFIFPQMKGLGRSEMSQRYAISSLDEAMAYMRHPVLGHRLRECTNAVNGVENVSINTIFPWGDHMKFHSSVTLFAHATENNQVFLTALEKYFNGRPDSKTLDLIS